MRGESSDRVQEGAISSNRQPLDAIYPVSYCWSRMIITATIAIGCNHLKRLRVKQIPHFWLFCDTAFERDHPTRRREWGLELRKVAISTSKGCPEDRDSA